MRSAYYEEQYDYFRRHYNISPNFRFNGVDVRIYGDGEIELGNNSYIGNYSTLQLTRDTVHDWQQLPDQPQCENVYFQCRP